MTMHEIADRLDDYARRMIEDLMPNEDDPDRKRKAYVLGIACFAVTQRAEQLRSLAPATDD